LHDDGTPFVVSAGQLQSDGSTKWLNQVFTSLDKAQRYAERKNRDGFNVYIKHGLFDGATRPNGTPICSREHSLGSRTLAVDVDAGPEKAYPSVQDALQAFYAAVSSAQTEHNLPPYNLLLDTGHGLHGAWVLDQVLMPGRWASSTATLYKMLEKFGLKPDRGMKSIDKALRLGLPDGSIANHKAPAAAVVLLHEGQRLPLAAMEAALGPERLTLVQPSRVDARDGNFDIPSNYKFSIDAVVDDCLVLKHMAATKGADVEDYDLWHRSVMQAARDHDEKRGEYWAHTFSEGHAKYNPNEVDDKIADARRGGQQLITCREFALHTAICQTCPWWGKVNSAGGIPKQKRLEIATAFTLPDPRYVNGQYSLLLQYTDENGKLEEITIVKGYHFGLVSLFTDEAGEQTMEFVYFPSSQPKHQQKVSLKVAEFRSIPVMVDSLAKFQLVLPPGAHKRFLEALVAWLDAMRNQGKARRNHTRMGWTEDGAFVTGGVLHGLAGSTPFAPKGYMAAYQPNGDLGSFMKLARTIMASELRPEAHMLMAVSFAAPLLSLAGVPGATLCFWSNESGLGKSTLMSLAAAVWGRPQRTISTTSDTINAVTHKAGILRSMPWLFDDMTATTIKDNFDTFLRQATTGREKDRLNAIVSLEGGGDWQTIFCLAANVSLASVMVQSGKIDQAMNARYLDIEMPRFASQTIDRIAVSRAKHELERQYGLLGPEYAKIVVARQDPLKDALDKCSAVLQNNTQGVYNDAFSRFHVSTASCLIVGARLAKRHLDFPVEPDLVSKATIEALVAASRQRRQMGVDIDAGQLLRKFLNSHAGARLITIASGMAGKPNVLIPEHPLPRNTVVYEIDRAKRVIYIDAVAFARFVAAELQNHRLVLDQLRRAYGIVKAVRALGPRTKYGTTTMEVLALYVPNQGGPWSEFFLD
jgi:hypothetical protein